VSGSSRPRRQRQSEASPPRSPGATESTRSLLDRARSGDSTALEEVCARYLPRLARWAEGRLPARARRTIDTGDLVQDTLINTLEHLPVIRADFVGSFPAYLRTAILNRIRNEHRRLARQQEETARDDAVADLAPNPLEETIGRDLAARYEAGLSRLSEKDRSILFLRLEMHMKYRDIAEALDKSNANAARMAALRAMERLAREIEP
jgi:RNA polymerase sigma factor (sigma-70 family)